MSDNLKKSFKGLEYISQLSPTIRNKSLSQLSCHECYYRALKEIAINIINKNIKVKKSLHPKLKGKWKKIAQISNSNSKIPKYKKKALVVQSGGRLWAIIPLISGIIEALK